VIEKAVKKGITEISSFAASAIEMVRQATTVAELRHKMREKTDEMVAALIHTCAHAGCSQHNELVVSAVLIVELLLMPVAGNVCAGESFSVFRERVVRDIETAKQRRIASFNNTEVLSAAKEYLDALRTVEVAFATEEVKHGATRH